MSVGLRLLTGQIVCKRLFEKQGSYVGITGRWSVITASASRARHAGADGTLSEAEVTVGACNRFPVCAVSVVSLPPTSAFVGGDPNANVLVSARLFRPMIHV